MAFLAAIFGLLWASAASASPWLAFTHVHDGNAEICLTDTAGNQHRRLTASPGDDADPAWSPDGRTLAFVTARGGAPAIWIMDSDGGDPRPAQGEDWVAGVEGYLAPAWSPGGDRIAYLAYGGDGVLGRMYYQTAVPGTPLSLDVLGSTPWRTLSLGWGPDGHSLHMTAEVLEPEAGGDRGALTAWGFGDVVGSTTTPLPAANLSFSRDGTPAFDADGDLWVGGLLFSGETVNITDTPGVSESHPAWSADGRWLAYQADGWLWVCRADGSQARRVVQGADPAWAPRWWSTAVSPATWGSVKQR